MYYPLLEFLYKKIELFFELSLMNSYP